MAMHQGVQGSVAAPVPTFHGKLSVAKACSAKSTLQAPITEGLRMR